MDIWSWLKEVAILIVVYEITAAEGDLLEVSPLNFSWKRREPGKKGHEPERASLSVAVRPA
jgi:hypothetical protein